MSNGEKHEEGVNGRRGRVQYMTTIYLYALYLARMAEVDMSSSHWLPWELVKCDPS